MERFLIILPIIILAISFQPSYSSHNPNLMVSAENPVFDNYFSGAMIVEVIVNDPNLIDTSQSKGEPNVTINGKQLRMVQAVDGKWYAYFANVELAKNADQIVLDAATQAESLDFGVFCSKDTESSILGVGFSQTQGVAIPREGGISGATNGIESFNACTGSPTAAAILNNVVRIPKTLNTNSNVPTGQIGINQNAWPIIQLYSFDDVKILYNRAGGAQTVELEYDEIPNISFSLDRVGYPKGAEVFVIINDSQLNQDPTARDSWTFNVVPPLATFYQAFTENGADAANGGAGLINLTPKLAQLGFEKNGMVSLSLDNIVELTSNDNQPVNFVTDGTTSYGQIITLLESTPSSGIFESFDSNSKSTITVSRSANRGETDTISYNSKSSSIVSGTFSAEITIDLPVKEPAESTMDIPAIEPAQTKIPDWIKNNAKWWSNGQIPDADFLSGIEYLMERGIMIVPKTELTQQVALPSVPGWIKDTAGWWAAGQVTDEEFVNGLQWLIEHGIIRV